MSEFLDNMKLKLVGNRNGRLEIRYTSFEDGWDQKGLLFYVYSCGKYYVIQDLKNKPFYVATGVEGLNEFAQKAYKKELDIQVKLEK